MGFAVRLRGATTMVDFRRLNRLKKKRYVHYGITHNLCSNTTDPKDLELKLVMLTKPRLVCDDKEDDEDCYIGIPICW